MCDLSAYLLQLLKLCIPELVQCVGVSLVHSTQTHVADSVAHLTYIQQRRPQGLQHSVYIISFSQLKGTTITVLCPSPSTTHPWSPIPCSSTIDVKCRLIISILFFWQQFCKWLTGFTMNKSSCKRFLHCVFFLEERLLYTAQVYVNWKNNNNWLIMLKIHY